jgi:pimeloyl-[acyl-carrier protein] methyl ester esterase
MMDLVLLHGWGFDRHFWDPLAERLADFRVIAWDLGFTGATDKPVPAAGAVAIGHSYGLLWLLQHRPFAWRKLVSINGFTRFAEAGDFPEGIALKQIERLSGELAQAPLACVAAFRQRCGDTAPAPARIDEPKLQASLDDLRQWDQRGDAVDLALCGEADRVVPPALSRACFPAARIEWHEGGHLLPLAEPDWCAARLRHFLASSP